MNFFSESLARLKHELRVSKDGEVAAALGLSKTAFSERKKRGAFPENELKNLAETRPELEIDVLYVLTGEREPRDRESHEEFVSRMQAINHMNAVVAALPLNELGRMRLQALMTGDPAEDGKLIGNALLNRADIERPKVDPGGAHGATVTPLREAGSGLLTRDQVLKIVLDAMHQAGKALPSKAVQALVDTAMELQRAGVPVKKSAFDAQLRAAQ